MAQRAHRAAESLAALRSALAQHRLSSCCSVAVIVWLAYSAVTNAADNLARAAHRVRLRLLELDRRLRHQPDADPVYGAARPMAARSGSGLLNTLLVSVLGIIFATILGFIDRHPAIVEELCCVAKLAAGYVEVIRNLPLLLQLLFWYNAVLKALPGLRDSISIPGGVLLNNRGLFLPKPIFGPGFEAVPIAFVLGIAGSDRIPVLGAAPADADRAAGAGLHVGYAR